VEAGLSSKSGSNLSELSSLSKAQVRKRKKQKLRHADEESEVKEGLTSQAAVSLKITKHSNEKLINFDGFS